MAVKYKKIVSKIWKDEKFLPLNLEERSIVFYVLTAQTNRIGLFDFSPALASEDTGIEYGAFLEAFNNVCSSFGWKYDSTFRVLYIPTWWKYNQPEGKNVLIGNLKDLQELPKTNLIKDFYENIEHLNEDYHQVFQEGCAELSPLKLEPFPEGYTNTSGNPTYTPSGTLTQPLPEGYTDPSPIQEQEQEQEQDIKETTLVPSSDKSDSERAPEVKQVENPILKIPLNVKETFFAVFQNDIDQWQETFPGIDVLAEIKKCRQWNMDSPKRRKTKDGIRRHISSWLGKAQNRASPSQVKNGRQQLTNRQRYMQEIGDALSPEVPTGSPKPTKSHPALPGSGT